MDDKYRATSKYLRLDSVVISVKAANGLNLFAAAHNYVGVK